GQPLLAQELLSRLLDTRQVHFVQTRVAVLVSRWAEVVCPGPRRPLVHVFREAAESERDKALLCWFEDECRRRCPDAEEVLRPHLHVALDLGGEDQGPGELPGLNQGGGDETGRQRASGAVVQVEGEGPPGATLLVVDAEFARSDGRQARLAEEVG